MRCQSRLASNARHGCYNTKVSPGAWGLSICLQRFYLVSTCSFCCWKSPRAMMTSDMHVHMHNKHAQRHEIIHRDHVSLFWFRWARCYIFSFTFGDTYARCDMHDTLGTSFLSTRGMCKFGIIISASVLYLGIILMLTRSFQPNSHFPEICFCDTGVAFLTTRPQLWAIIG